MNRTSLKQKMTYLFFVSLFLIVCSCTDEQLLHGTKKVMEPVAVPLGEWFLSFFLLMACIGGVVIALIYIMQQKNPRLASAIKVGLGTCFLLSAIFNFTPNVNINILRALLIIIPIGVGAYYYNNNNKQENQNNKKLGQ